MKVLYLLKFNVRLIYSHNLTLNALLRILNDLFINIRKKLYFAPKYIVKYAWEVL